MKIRLFEDVTRWVRQPTASPLRGLILVYHRVTCVDRDPQQLCVTPGRFAEHLEVIRRVGNPVPLDEFLVDRHRAGAERPAIAVTFDDGYADNYHEARPILEKYHVPATVFIASGYLGQNDEFWWDELESLLLEPGCLPTRFQLEIGRRTMAFRLKSFAKYDAEREAFDRKWSLLDKRNPTPRHELYRQLCAALRPLSVDDRNRSLRSLRRWASRPPPERSTHRAMTHDEVRRLDASPLVSLGAHTVHHPVLSELSRAEQALEIGGSKRTLEEILGHPISAFSFPFGAPSDYNDHSLEVLRELGFSIACANRQGEVRVGDDQLQLKRRLVRNWGGRELEKHLRKWLRKT